MALHLRVPSSAWVSLYTLLITVTLIFVFHHKPEGLPLAKLLQARNTGYDPFDAEANYNLSRHELLRRDDYSCGPGNPCSNGACCGGSGYCGYGPTYCGKDCVSNCGAIAECGEYAVPANKKCPLNTCCSQYGFCGTTTDFCGKECQSNCVQHPKPPGGNSGKPLDRVIGYWEAWNARSECHKMAPSDIAIDALTHVNYAFAYIDPTSFEVTTMDTATKAETFKACTDLKSIKPELKVWVSIGGWTFSDNGTSTQLVFGNIAGSASNRQKFANNLVRFMNLYGFDGVDLDWEYPGAPDRGGRKEDTANYVLLVQTLKTTFQSSGKSFGLSFTAPSSYWYLRWFDLPGMVKHVDWINLMSYDLHGVWDRNNPIGSIVQGHTNLTEIKLATELFWRVGVQPGKVALGFGFYGRAFTLADPSCTTPGCQFSGASKPGPCTATAGYLGYYEIAALLKGNGASPQKRAVKVVHDEKAAVNYFTYGSDQWISYDDKRTFKEKTDWASSVGIGGSLIWASDLDDDQYSQHSGLVGRSLKQTQDIVNPVVTDPQKQPPSLAAELGQNCFKKPDCVDLNNQQAAGCGPGFTTVGWDDAGCGSKKCHCGKPICCPTNAAPKNCQWRGGKAGDCDGRCAAGEVNIKGFGSSWGGGFKNDGNTNKCGRGYKVFCCTALDYEELIDGCKLGPCGGGCPTGFDKTYPAAYNPDNPLGTCPYYYAAQDYCCPSPTRFKECRWEAGDNNPRGFADCPNAHCEADEIEIAQSSYGDSAFECAWGQKQVACCKLTKPAAAGPDHLTCNVDLCSIENGYCTSDDGGPLETKRNVLAIEDGTNHYGVLEKRGGPNPYPIFSRAGVELFRIRGTRWNPVRNMFESIAGRNARREIIYLPEGDNDDCTIIRPTSTQIPSGPTPYPSSVRILPYRAQDDHTWEQQIQQYVVQAGVTRRLPSGRDVVSPMNSSLSFWRDSWNSAVLRQGLGPVGPGGIDPQIPAQRVGEAGGSVNNQQDLIPLAAELNGPKGRMFNLVAPTASSRIRTLATTAARTGTVEDARALMRHFQIALGVFEHLNGAGLGQEAFNRAHALTMQQYSLLEGEMQGAVGLEQFASEVIGDYLTTVGDTAQGWAAENIVLAERIFGAARDGDGNRPNTYTAVIAALSAYRNRIQRMTLPRGENGDGT